MYLVKHQLLKCFILFLKTVHILNFVEKDMSFSKPSRSTGGAGYSVICSQARKMLFAVYNFLKKYVCRTTIKLDFSKCQDLTGEACGVSASSAYRICREAKILKDECLLLSCRRERATREQQI
jgi:hypothetical protein